MKFKTARIEQEWKDMVAGDEHDLLIPVALFVDELSRSIIGRDAIVTMIDRWKEEQAELIEVVNAQRLAAGKQPWLPSRKSVHQYWRGIDFRSWIYTEQERDMLIDRINKRFKYRQGLRVLAYHASGTAGHLHCQIPAGQRWRM